MDGKSQKENIEKKRKMSKKNIERKMAKKEHPRGKVSKEKCRMCKVEWKRLSSH